MRTRGLIESDLLDIKVRPQTGDLHACRPCPRIPTLIERLTPDVVYGSFPEEALGGGRDAVEQGRVSRPDLRLARADAVVVGADRRAHRARLAWLDDGLFSSCTCGARRCGHAAALGLLLLGEARPAESEDDDAATSPREAERQRRVSRGASELFDIRRRQGGRQDLLGVYEVASPSSRAYRVTLRALDAAHNGCDCPDFATNLLGTCKHVEAVLHHLRTEAPRTREARLRRGTGGARRVRRSKAPIIGP